MEIPANLLGQWFFNFFRCNAFGNVSHSCQQYEFNEDTYCQSFVYWWKKKK